MNSKQRRIFNRKWCYKVPIASQISLKKLNEIELWCHNKYGKKGYQYSHWYFGYSTDFKLLFPYQSVNLLFDSLEKLTEFNIVWWETINANNYDE
jgi:hypothetical protein